MNDLQRRDAAIKRRLRHRRQAPAGAEGGVCPDVERLALLAGGSLSDEERAPNERHVADCVRCQDTLAVLAQLDEVAGSSNAEPERVEWAWWTAWRRWRWVVPVPVAAALAATIYVAVRPAPVAEIAPADSMVARHEPEAMGPPPAAPSLQAERSEPPAAATSAVPTAALPPAAPRPDPKRVATPGSAPATPGRTAADDVAGAGAAAAEARAEASRQVADAARTAPAAEAVAAETLAAREQAVPAAPPATRSARAAAPEAAATAGFALEAAKERPPVDVDTPDPSQRWRVEADGRLTRSVDGGTSWEPVALSTTHALRAGACPRVSICWFVGAQGTIVRTTDGARWDFVLAPVVADFEGVDASSADAAAVWTAAARFVTTDGGRTWRPADR